MTEASATSDAAGGELAERARRQQACIDQELGRGRASRRGLAKRKTTDPENGKNLLIFRRLLGEAAELRQRRHLSEPEQVRLGAAMELPEPAAGTLKVLLARRFQLEQVLLELADRTYLTGRLADLYGEGPGTYVTWKGMYGDALPALLDPGKAATRHQEVRSNAAAASEPAAQAEHGFTDEAVVDHEVERIRLQLKRLLREKEAQDQVMRARQELINRAILKTICVVGLMSAAFATTSFWVLHDGELIVLALVAGGTGAGLGGLIKLRDEVQLVSQARRFWPALVAQILIGSIAGILTFLVYRTGTVVVAGKEAGVAVLAVAFGFSEAAFISLLTRFTNPKTT
jgi:hypothetical protein